jgi:hypothetical protein
MSPGPGNKVWQALDRKIGKTGKDRRQIVQAIALGVAEQEQVPAQRIAQQPIPHETVESFEPLAYVRGSGCQIDPCGWTESKRPLRRPRHSPAARACPHQNHVALRPGDHPTTTRPVGELIRATSAISGRPILRVPTGGTQKVFYSFSSSVASSSDAGSACRSSNPDCGKIHCVACRC